MTKNVSGGPLAVALSLVLSLVSMQLVASNRPNIVLILGDDMGYGDIGPYGAPDIRTPNLDQLAREGVRLTNAYAAAPVCSPSRAALMTGKYPARLGLETNVSRTEPEFGLSRLESTVALLLRESGYSTALFGKWHLGYSPEFGPNSHGFNRFLGFLDWTVDYYSHRTYEGEEGLYHNGNLVQLEGYLTEIITQRAVSFITQKAGEPFFLFASYSAALPPYQPPGQPEDVRSQETWKQGTRSEYVRVVESLDCGIGKILEALEENDLAETTLVIFAYDHGGEELSRSEPLFHGFATLWEGGIRVPCIMRWPGRLPANTVSHQMAISMDLTATILAAAGVPGTNLDGIDLLPILRGTEPAIDRTFFWRINFPIRRQKAVRSGRWKYIEDANAEMLFDLSLDLGERHNLIYKKPELVTKMQSLLRLWEKQFVTTQTQRHRSSLAPTKTRRRTMEPGVSVTRPCQGGTFTASLCNPVRNAG